MTINTKFKLGQEVWINIFDDIDRNTAVKGKIAMIRVYLSIFDYEIKTAERRIIRSERYIYGTEQAALENCEKERREIDYDCKLA